MSDDRIAGVPGVPRAAPRWRELVRVPPWALAVVAVLVVARTVGVALAVAPGQDAAPFPFLRALGQILSAGVGAVPIVVAVAATVRRGPDDGRRRIAALAAAVLASGAAGLGLRLTLGSLTGVGPSWQGLAPLAMTVLPRNVLVGALLAAALEFARRERRSLEQARETELRRAATQRERAESLLQLLRAQIEPHFLFNTLANVRRLLEQDGPRGRAMLSELALYLETALPSLREDGAWSLGRELDLAAAYLRLHAVRMGPRLTYAIDAPAALRGAALPPMMLLTLVENAVKHGIDRAARGGHVAVRARSVDGSLEARVSDDGVGFAAGTAAGTGTGLANLQSRLAAEFGAAAELALEGNEAGGVTATVRLPLRQAVPAA
jgi:signal transduction histidine kinase